jgi:hypothetical protein
MGRFVSATGQFLLATNGQLSWPPVGNFRWPLTSLGFTLTDETRAQHLHDGTVARWASRGKAYRFEHRVGSRWQTLVDLAASAISVCGPTTRGFWRERIMSVASDSVMRLVAAAPEMSEIARVFTVELIMVNRGRLLDVLS